MAAAVPARNRSVYYPDGPVKRVGVESRLGVVENLALSLLAVKATARRDDRGSEVETRFEPAGMGAEPVRQHRGAQRRKILPQLMFSEIGMNPDIEVGMSRIIQ